MADNILINGLFFKTPNEKAPDFVKSKISFKVADVIQFLEENQDDKGWVNGNLNEAKSGHWYAQLDTWKPDPNFSSNSSSGSTWGNDKPKESGGFKPPTGGFSPAKTDDFNDGIPF